MNKLYRKIKVWLNRKPSYWYVSYVFFDGEERGCSADCIESPNQLFDFRKVNKQLRDKLSFKKVVILSFSKVDKSLYKQTHNNN